MKEVHAREIMDLEDKFFINWEKPVDYSGISDSMPLQMKYLVLRRIVDTGESVMDASKKLGILS